MHSDRQKLKDMLHKDQIMAWRSSTSFYHDCNSCHRNLRTWRSLTVARTSWWRVPGSPLAYATLLLKFCQPLAWLPKPAPETEAYQVPNIDGEWRIFPKLLPAVLGEMSQKLQLKMFRNLSVRLPVSQLPTVCGVWPWKRTVFGGIGSNVSYRI